MKKLNMLFVVGLFSFVMAAGMCYAATTATASTLLGAAQQYLDTSQLNAFKAAFDANAASATPLGAEEFFLDYCSKHPDFAKACQDAIDKAKKDQNVTTTTDTSNALSQQVTDLKKQIDDNKKLTDDQKQEYEDLMKKYDDQVKQLQQQLTSAQQAATQAAQQASSAQQSNPQQQDNSQMMMMMMMMMMAMMQNKNGGGGEDCQGGDCGG